MNVLKHEATVKDLHQGADPVMISTAAVDLLLLVAGVPEATVNALQDVGLQWTTTTTVVMEGEARPETTDRHLPDDMMQSHTTPADHHRHHQLEAMVSLMRAMEIHMAVLEAHRGVTVMEAAMAATMIVDTSVMAAHFLASLILSTGNPSSGLTVSHGRRMSSPFPELGLPQPAAVFSKRNIGYQVSQFTIITESQACAETWFGLP